MTTGPLKECLHAAGGPSAPVDDLFGILSLMCWSLIMVVSVSISASSCVPTVPPFTRGNRSV